jgi:hypothetical protein
MQRLGAPAWRALVYFITITTTFQPFAVYFADDLSETVAWFFAPNPDGAIAALVLEVRVWQPVKGLRSFNIFRVCWLPAIAPSVRMTTNRISTPERSCALAQGSSSRMVLTQFVSGFGPHPSRTCRT